MSEFKYTKVGKPVADSWLPGSTIPFDKRTGCYVSQGTDYGVGKTQPMGSKTTSNQSFAPEGSRCFKYEPS